MGGVLAINDIGNGWVFFLNACPHLGNMSRSLTVHKRVRLNRSRGLVQSSGSHATTRGCTIPSNGDAVVEKCVPLTFEIPRNGLTIFRCRRMQE